MCFFGVAQVPLHLGAYVETLRVGPVQIRVVAASVHGCEHGEQGLARVQGDGSTLPGAERRQQAEKGRNEASSQARNQETTQEFLPQDDHPTGHDPTIGGEHLKFKGLCAEGQT